MDMQNVVDMRRKELYLAEGKISALDLVGCDTKTLLLGKREHKELLLFSFMVAGSRHQYFLCVSRPEVSTSFSQGQDREGRFLYHLNL